LFLRLPAGASKRFPSRGQVAIKGTIEGHAFRTVLDPDGDGGHWLKVPRALRLAVGAQPGDSVTLDISPDTEDPEPRLPPDVRGALASAGDNARKTWASITPAARRDYLHWIVSPKKPETRAKRIATACDMLAKGKRRPCCFDRSGVYSRSLRCPAAAEDPPRAT
jgi:hypothetical protein